MATRHFCDICDVQVSDPKEFHGLSLTKPDDNFRGSYTPQKVSINLRVPKQICEKCHRSIEKHVSDLFDMARTKVVDK